MTANGSPAPDVRLGATADDGIAASIFALVERGAARRPELAREMRGRIELCFEEGLAPVRLGFEEGALGAENSMSVTDCLADPVAPVRARRQSPVATGCARSASRRRPRPAPPLRA